MKSVDSSVNLTASRSNSHRSYPASFRGFSPTFDGISVSCFERRHSDLSEAQTRNCIDWTRWPLRQVMSTIQCFPSSGWHCKRNGLSSLVHWRWWFDWRKHHRDTPQAQPTSPKRKRSCSHSFSIWSETKNDLSEPLTVIERIEPSSTYLHHKRQFLIEMPEDIDISADVLLRYLKEKFSPLVSTHNGESSSTYLLRPVPLDERMKCSPDLSPPVRDRLICHITAKMRALLFDRYAEWDRSGQKT